MITYKLSRTLRRQQEGIQLGITWKYILILISLARPAADIHLSFPGPIPGVIFMFLMYPILETSLVLISSARGPCLAS